MTELYFWRNFLKITILSKNHKKSLKMNKKTANSVLSTADNDWLTRKVSNYDTVFFARFSSF